MNEIHHNFATGKALRLIRFQNNGNVFLSDGASDEVWGTDGRGEDEYKVDMAEEANSGHYVGDFDPGGNIAAGHYPVVVRTGGQAVAEGVSHWDGTEEIFSSLDEVIEGVITSREAMRLLLSVLAGKASGGGTSTLTFRDMGDTKDRITVEVDKTGNRITIVTDTS